MRLGVHTETGYPTHNCTGDTLKLLLKSSDPTVVKLGRYIERKKRRPRFDLWISTQTKRDDEVGAFAKWLTAQQRDEGRFLMKLHQPPSWIIRFFLNATERYGVRMSKPARRGLAPALEEWDRWEFDVKLSDLRQEGT